MTEDSKAEELDRFSITVQASLKEQVDKLAQRLQMNRSALVRLALMRAIRHPECLIQGGEGSGQSQPTATQ